MTVQVSLIEDKSASGRRGVRIAAASDAERFQAREAIPAHLRRKAAPALPEVSELDTVRHFTRLSQKNFSIDGQFYPLGSCTMKYNPKVNDAVASLPGFAGLHPMQPEADCQGTLEVIHTLQEILKEVLGLAEVSLAAAAGAQGEYAGMAMIKEYHRQRGEEAQRTLVLVPDSAHGTNPASAALAGFSVKTVKSNAQGRVDLEALKAAVAAEPTRIAGIMLTNPNTCGVFETDILEISRVVHQAGGLLYYDGANLNAIVGRVRPGDMGFDAVHINLHKTFSTPHGGGGPGAAAVGVSKRLLPYLPQPHILAEGNGEGRRFRFATREDLPRTIGKLMAFHGNAGVLVRALAYALAQGGQGLWDVATLSVLNANYVLAQLPPEFEQPFPKPCKHEALVTVRKMQKEKGVKAFDVAKRLLDLGYHAPTIYFPLLVPECLLIEPTETESRETLDGFVAAMRQIAREMHEDPEMLQGAPHTLPTGRMDEAAAAKELNVCCRWGIEETPTA